MNPRLGHAYVGLTDVALILGRLDQALAAAKRAVECDPLLPFYNYLLAFSYLALGGHESALNQIQTILEINPDFPLAHFGRGIVLNASGKTSEAIQALEEAVRCSKGGPYAVGQLAGMSARSGDHRRAERELQSLLDRADSQYVPVWLTSPRETPTRRDRRMDSVAAIGS